MGFFREASRGSFRVVLLVASQEGSFGGSFRPSFKMVLRLYLIVVACSSVFALSCLQVICTISTLALENQPGSTRWTSFSRSW